MALTNIELYEALKRAVSEEAARMIAEAVSRAGDMATRGDLAAVKAEVKADIAEVKAEIYRLEQIIQAGEARLKSYIDSRLLRFSAAILIPMVVSMLGTFGALVTIIVQL